MEKTLESPLDCKEIKLVSPKGNQLIGRTDAEAEVPVFWPPEARSRLTGKDLDSGKESRQKKAATEDEMAGWHHQFYGHELWQTPVSGKGQGILRC